jgi:hypothetical protein
MPRLLLQIPFLFSFLSPQLFFLSLADEDGVAPRPTAPLFVRRRWLMVGVPVLAVQAVSQGHLGQSTAK